PNLSYYEDMYVQASEYFPGVRVDEEAQKITLDVAQFRTEVSASYIERLEQPDTFTLSRRYSTVYAQFLELALTSYTAIRAIW
ncbi:MAG: hypothetical protein Q7R34_03990, partial [Dehalococcoidia bacterium]|nr:hypothetical protein [Dehalococcoidia bacterium]